MPSPSVSTNRGSVSSVSTTPFLLASSSPSKMPSPSVSSLLASVSNNPDSIGESYVPLKFLSSISSLIPSPSESVSNGFVSASSGL